MPEDLAVTRFREYLRIETVHPTPDYQKCREFLEQQAKEIGLPVRVVECVAGKPIVILTWPGSDPSLSSIILNSHSDVVPVFPEKWSYPPFDAVKLPNGDIVARGSQDMKCVGMAYLEAIRNLIKQGSKPMRTFHIIFVPDEEIGGIDGMLKFTKHPLFAELNVGFALDEGLANPGDSYKLFYGERAPLWIKIRAEGNVGHGSQFIKNTAASKLQRMINKLLEFRDSEMFRLENMLTPNGQPLTLGDVTTVNWTMSNGGVQYNVVPQYLEAGFDIRVSPCIELERFKAILTEWCQECDCKLIIVQNTDSNPLTSISKLNPWLKAIQDASKKAGATLEYEIFPASTDGRYLRLSGVPTFGISPIRRTPILLHDHDEYLNENVFLEGITWYEHVLLSLAAVERRYEQEFIESCAI